MEYSSKQIINLIQLILDKLDQLNSFTQFKALEMDSELLTDSEIMMDKFNLEIVRSILLSLLQLMQENSILDVIEFEFPDLAFELLQIKAFIALLDFKAREF